MFKTNLLIAISVFTLQGLLAQSVLPTAPSFWLIADSINQANNTKVSVWKDLSNNATNAFQKVDFKTPTLKKNSLNGHAVVEFDGEDDILQTDEVELTKGYEIDIFMVYKSTGDNDIICELSKQKSYYKSGFYIIDHFVFAKSGICAAVKGNAKGGCYEKWQRGESTKRTDDSSKDYKLINCYIGKDREEASQISIIKNGERLLANKASSYCKHTDKFGNGNFFLGRGGNTNFYCMNGEIAEVIVFPNILIPRERETVERYLMTKYFPNMQ